MSDRPSMSEAPSERSCREFDPAAWVDEHGDCLFRYALAKLGDRTVAEDLVQETFLAALGAQKTFSGRSAERTWLVGILKHKVLDYMRRHLRRQGRQRPRGAAYFSEQPVDEPFDNQGRWLVKPGKWPVNPRDALEEKEFWEAFRRCLEHLPKRLHTVFSLREIEDLPTEEICDTLTVTPGNLGVLLYRARLRLRKCLEINWFGVASEEG